jgi:hypothetical protein
MHQMRISTNEVSSVVLRPKKLEIQAKVSKVYLNVMFSVQILMDNTFARTKNYIPCCDDDSRNLGCRSVSAQQPTTRMFIKKILIYSQTYIQRWHLRQSI